MIRHPLFERMLASPLLPEIVEEAQAIMMRERALRDKFYNDVTPGHKREFINGEVIMHSPAHNRQLMATKRLFSAMHLFVLMRNLGEVHVEKAMTSFPRNDYEPDICFFGVAKAGLIMPDTLKFPVPDLIVEVISPSTEARDRGVKFDDYSSHGVAEYWLVDPAAETVELYRLQDHSYPTTIPQREGTLESEVIPGFQIPVRAIFDDATSLQALRSLMEA